MSTPLIFFMNHKKNDRQSYYNTESRKGDNDFGQALSLGGCEEKRLGKKALGWERKKLKKAPKGGKTLLPWNREYKGVKQSGLTPCNYLAGGQGFEP
jgi:hypothetical protein